MLNLNCIICAELFTHADEVFVTTCGHMFHFPCLNKWLERSKTCPQCRNKCYSRSIVRVYFNIANLDVSHVDVCSIQEQLDNANLQIKIKEKDLKEAETKLNDIKDTKKKCMRTIAGLEEMLKAKTVIISSYAEQIKILKIDVKVVDDLRSEVKILKNQLEILESVSTLLSANRAEAESMLKTENDPRKLSLLATTLKKELRACQMKKTEQHNILKSLQNDLRRKNEKIKSHEERISELESENYNLNQKLETNSSNPKKAVHQILENHINAEEKRLTISPTIKNDILKIENSDSPYLNIKSSSIGLTPLGFHRPILSEKRKLSSNSTISNGLLRKTQSDLSAKYSIFKKPRVTSDMLSPIGLAPNFVYNGFGGTVKVDPFAKDDLNDKKTIKVSPIKMKSRSNLTSLNTRVKSGNLRNLKNK